ncbi:MAG: heavy metal-responsive transcriptional regulator [Vicinamibacteria bacterium]
MPRDQLLIGELAHRAGINRETLRYYERRGLLRPTRRTASGYRLYSRETEERLSFIKRAQSFGFTLDEILMLLGLRPESPQSCRRVLAMLDEKVFDLAGRIGEMKKFHRQLSRYRDRCVEASERGARCPVIATVSRG